MLSHVPRQWGHCAVASTHLEHLGQLRLEYGVRLDGGSPVVSILCPLRVVQLVGLCAAEHQRPVLLLVVGGCTGGGRSSRGEGRASVGAAPGAAKGKSLTSTARHAGAVADIVGVLPVVGAGAHGQEQAGSQEVGDGEQHLGVQVDRKLVCGYAI